MLKPASFGLIGTAVKFIDRFFQAVWNVISKLNLHLALTVAAVWVVCLAFLPAERTGGSFRSVFFVLLIISLVYAVLVTAVRVIRYVKSAPERRKNKAKVSVSTEEIAAGMNEAKYYRVAQNPHYVMADYPDRYELYYNDNGNLKFVRMKMKSPAAKEKNDE